jgi:hypothetical protein
MATENTEPKSGLILRVAVLAVVSLVGIRFALVSYYNANMDDELHRKVASVKSPQLVELRAQEQKALTGSALPIDKAMVLYATHPREMAGEALAPQPSTDTAALVGWMQRPRPLPTPPTGAQNAAVTMPAGTAVPAADGGADSLAQTDAGAAAAAADGSAPAVPGTP